MTTFPNSPKLLKGVLGGIDLFSSQPSAIFLQFNPTRWCAWARPTHLVVKEVIGMIKSGWKSLGE